jgi:hypothetical protein
MVKVSCHTNLDVREVWPETLPCRPVNGDIIRSEWGLELCVVRVYFDEFRYPEVIQVELHIPPHRFQNINDFDDWYNLTKKKHPSLKTNI